MVVYENENDKIRAKGAREDVKEMESNNVNNDGDNASVIIEGVIEDSVESVNREEESSVTDRIMLRMGYQSGKGLGKNLQGRSVPVTLNECRNREGLGLTWTNEQEYQEQAATGFIQETIEQEQNMEEIIHQILHSKRINNQVILVVIKGTIDGYITELSIFGPAEIEKIYTDAQAKTKILITYTLPENSNEAMEFIEEEMARNPPIQEPEAVENEERQIEAPLRPSEMPIPQPIVQTGPLDDTAGLRFCAQVPLGMNHDEFIRIFAVFGPLDNILFVLQKNQESDKPHKKYLAFIQYFSNEDARRAMDHCHNRFRQTWSTPKQLKKMQGEYRREHPVCHRMVDARLKEEHER